MAIDSVLKRPATTSCFKANIIGAGNMNLENVTVDLTIKVSWPWSSG